MAIRTWQVLATAILLLALLIGGTGGYLIRLATAPAQTVVRTISQPAAAFPAETGGSSAQPACVVIHLDGRDFKGC
jgi:hypothetical protein